MNLSAYDKVIEKIDKTKTWVNISSKILYSREISKRNYCSIIKKYNPTNNTTNFYIVTLDDKPDDSFTQTKIDSFGRFFIRVNTIWFNCNLHKLDKSQNINIVHKEHTDDGDIYYLDI